LIFSPYITATRENLIKVLKRVGDGLTLRVESDAREYYDHWYLNLEESIHSRRLDTYSIRLMMLLAANSLKNTIDLETAKHATALCDWELEIRKMYDPIDADSNMAKMEESIRRNLLKAPLKDWELKRKTGAHRAGLWVYNNAVKNMERCGEIGWDKRYSKWHYMKN